MDFVHDYSSTLVDPNSIAGFGATLTGHMLLCRYIDGKGWQEPTITDVSKAPVHPPHSVAFHYGQMIFEGLKAYRSADDKVYLFRVDANARRMHNSAKIMMMEPVPEELFIEGIKELVKVDAKWVLPAPYSLYLRPILLPTDVGVSYRRSKNYDFIVLASPVKFYYQKENSVTVYVEPELVRAVPGGVGEAKCAGNYGGSLRGLQRAIDAGAEQVLWLDGLKHRFIEEVGSMNVMFAYGNKVITPRLSGSILPGVTRDSILKLGRTLGLEMHEEEIAIEDMIADLKSGKLTEAFGCGTAAVITPIDSFIYQGKKHELKNPIGNQTMRLKKELMRIQAGESNDEFSWLTLVC